MTEREALEEITRLRDEMQRYERDLAAGVDRPPPGMSEPEYAAMKLRIRGEVEAERRAAARRAQLAAESHQPATRARVPARGRLRSWRHRLRGGVDTPA